MEMLGRVERGVVVPQGGEPLPDGATVRILYEPRAEKLAEQPCHRVQFPLVRTGKPGTLHLTNQMIGEILDEEDFSPRH